MSKVFSALSVSVDGYITGRDPGDGRGLGDAIDAVRLVLRRRHAQRGVRRVPAERAQRPGLRRRRLPGGRHPRRTQHLRGLRPVRRRRRPAPDGAAVRPEPPARPARWASGRRWSPPGSRTRSRRPAQAAGEKDVALMGGGVVTAALAAGLVDELLLHQVPVLLGASVPTSAATSTPPRSPTSPLGNPVPLGCVRRTRSARVGVRDGAGARDTHRHPPTRHRSPDAAAAARGAPSRRPPHRYGVSG